MHVQQNVFMTKLDKVAKTPVISHLFNIFNFPENIQTKICKYKLFMAFSHFSEPTYLGKYPGLLFST